MGSASSCSPYEPQQEFVLQLNDIELSCVLENIGCRKISEDLLSLGVSGKALLYLAHLFLNRTQDFPVWFHTDPSEISKKSTAEELLAFNNWMKPQLTFLRPAFKHTTSREKLIKPQFSFRFRDRSHSIKSENSLNDKSVRICNTIKFAKHSSEMNSNRKDPELLLSDICHNVPENAVKSEELMQWQTKMHVVPRKILLELEELVKYQEGTDKVTLLTPVSFLFSWRDESKTVYRQQIVYVSHIWFSDNYPDDINNSKLEHLKHIAVTHPEWEYFLLDFMCFPQDDESARTCTVNSLPTFVKSCGSMVTLIGDDDKEEFATLATYKCSGWCMYEQFCSLVPAANFMGGVETNFFIANKHKKTCEKWRGLVSGELNPLKGNFSKENDRTAVAMSVQRICNHFTNSNLNNLQNLATTIQSSQEFQEFLPNF